MKTEGQRIAVTCRTCPRSHSDAFPSTMGRSSAELVVKMLTSQPGMNVDVRLPKGDTLLHTVKASWHARRQ